MVEVTEVDADDNKHNQIDSTVCKSLLLAYTQTQKLSYPIFDCTMSGEPHQPSFISTVTIDGRCYEGEECTTKKDAERSAARIALMAVTKNSDRDTKLVVEPNLGSYKSALKEYTEKHRFIDPRYEITVLAGGHQPLFVATVMVNRSYFKGEACSKKKWAEGTAAKAALAVLVPNLDEFLNEAPQVSLIDDDTSDAPQALLTNGDSLEAPQDSFTNGDTLEVFQDSLTNDATLLPSFMGVEHKDILSLEQVDVKHEREKRMSRAKRKLKLIMLGKYLIIKRDKKSRKR